MIRLRLMYEEEMSDAATEEGFVAQYPACDLCQYPAPLRPYNETTLGGERVVQMCELCATQVPNVNTLDKNWSYEQAHLLRNQRFCANAILDQMGAFSSSDPRAGKEANAE